MGHFPGFLRKLLVFPVSLTWGSHRDEYGLSRFIVREFLEEPPTTMQVEDPVIPGYTHRTSHGQRMIVELANVSYDPHSGTLWAENSPVLESSTFTNPLDFPRFRIPKLGIGLAFRPRTDAPVFPIRAEPYYHWLLEELPRLLRAIVKFPTVSLESYGNLHSYQLESLQELGLHISKSWSKRRRHLYRAICPTADRDSGWPHEADVQRLRSMYMKTLKTQLNGSNIGPRFYLVRDSPSRQIGDEAELVARLSDLGFQSIKMSALNFRSQITLISNADIIVSLHGGALANLVFAKKGALVIEIMSKNYANPCFQLLSQIIGLEYCRILYSDYRTDEREIFEQILTGIGRLRN